MTTSAAEQSQGLVDPDYLSETELQARWRVQEQLPEFEQIVRSEVRGFGGLYRDRDGTVVIAATAESLSEAYAVAELGPSEAAVRVTEVQWTLEDLWDARAIIRQEWNDLAADGIRLYTLGIDLKENRVQLGVREATPFVQEAVAARYGSIVAVQTASPSVSLSCQGRANCANPLKGGLAILRSDGSKCSSGFVAHSGSNIYLLTAGHCGGIYSSWTHGGVSIGTIQKRSYNDGAYADAAGIAISASQKSNLVYRGSLTSFFNVNALYTSTGLNDVVCLSARGLSSYDCGWITNVSIDICYCDEPGEPVFLDQVETTSIEAIGGASGGAVFTLPNGSNVSAAGLIVRSNILDNLQYYSKIDNVQWELGVATCTNGSCS